MKENMKSIHNFINSWSISTTPLEKRMDVSLVLFNLIFPIAGVLVYLVEGLSLTLNAFESIWILAFFSLTTLGLRLRLASRKKLILKEESQVNIHRLQLEEFRTLLHWSFCVIIALVLLVMSFAFPYVR